MKTYHSTSTHHVAGRGEVRTVKIPREDALPEPGDDILIDGEVKTVSGVECSRILTAPPIRGEDVGLVLRPKRYAAWFSSEGENKADTFNATDDFQAAVMCLDMWFEEYRTDDECIFVRDLNSMVVTSHNLAKVEDALAGCDGYSLPSKQKPPV